MTQKHFLLALFAVLTLAGCSRSPEQMAAACLAGTAHQWETGLAVEPVPIDKVSPSVINDCIGQFETTMTPRAAFGAARAAYAGKDYERALEWYEKAYDTGYRRDLAKNGIMLIHFEEAKDDAGFQRAIESGLRAKEADGMEAPLVLAQLYDDDGTAHFDFDRAIDNYLLVTRDYPVAGWQNFAKEHLSALYMTRAQTSSTPNKRQDLTEAMHWAKAWTDGEPDNVDA